MRLAIAVLLVAGGLDEQTLLSLIESHFGAAEISWLLMDARTYRLIGARWPEIAQPVPVGSLAKPFQALAYGATHAHRYPVRICSTGCWLPRGHGRLGLVEALAQSCNSYFEQIARDTDEASARAVASRYGLTGSTATAPQIARAYCELARRAGEPGVDEVLRGLAASADHGTGKGAGGGALAKTGTAPCTHQRRAPGDGFAMVLFPARRPGYALLVRLHGAPGAEAARKAGEILGLVRGPQ